MTERRLKKSLAALLPVLVLLLCLSPAALALVEQSESFYVVDNAGVLSQDTEEAIIQANALLESECRGAQLVVVTVDYLGGMYADEYAYELFNDWGVGSAENNNGMLLLLGIQEGKGWLAYGLGLSGALTGEQVDAWLEENFWEDFDRGDYDAAVDRLLPVMLDWYGQYYGAALPAGEAVVPRNTGSTVVTYQRRSPLAVILPLFLVVLVLSLLSALLRPVRRYRRRWSWRTGWRRMPPPPPPPMGGPGPYRGAPPPGAYRQNRPPVRPSRPSPPPKSGGFSSRGMSGGGRSGRPGGFSGQTAC